MMSRSEAKARGLLTFFTATGKTCKRGHISPRYTSNNACVECQNLTPEQRVEDENADPTKIGEADIIVHQPPPDEFAPRVPMAWTRVTREKLIETYIDTGDIVTARQVVGASPSEYEREIENNAAFAHMVDQAKPKADMRLRERARQLALKGNDKALIAELKMMFPEYRDTMKVEMQTTVRQLDDKKLLAKIEQLQKRLGFGVGQIIDAEFSNIESDAEFLERVTGTAVAT